MAGYLSLHQTASSLIIKWTPNQLMNCHSPGTNQNDHPEVDANIKRLVSVILYIFYVDEYMLYTTNVLRNNQIHRYFNII